jgi:hypothetical protein
MKKILYYLAYNSFYFVKLLFAISLLSVTVIWAVNDKEVPVFYFYILFFVIGLLAGYYISLISIKHLNK